MVISTTIMKKCATVLVAVTMLAVAIPAASAATTEELEAQLELLTEQLAFLQSQVSDYVFTNNLSRGSRGEEVRKLQEFLISEKVLILDTTTTYFGPLTQAALAKWQAQHDIAPAVGYFGPITRPKVNAVIAARNGTTATTPTDSNAPTTPTYPVVPTTPPVTEQNTNTSSIDGVLAAMTKDYYITTPSDTNIGSLLAIKFLSKKDKNVSIKLCNSAGVCVVRITLVQAVLRGENTYSWWIPGTINAGEYLIKIADAYTTAGNEVSSGLFSIGAKVTDGGVGLASASSTSIGFVISTPTMSQDGSSLKIKFSSTGVQNANIYLCSSAISCETVIVAGYRVFDGSNLYTWNVSATAGAGVNYVKIEDSNNPRIFAVSQSFTMQSGSTTSSTDGNVTITGVAGTGGCVDVVGTRADKTICEGGTSLNWGICYNRINGKGVLGSPWGWPGGPGVICDAVTTKTIKLRCCPPSL